MFATDAISAHKMPFIGIIIADWLLRRSKKKIYYTPKGWQLRKLHMNVTIRDKKSPRSQYHFILC